MRRLHAFLRRLEARLGAFADLMAAKADARRARMAVRK